MNTSLTTDPFSGFRFLEDAVTRLMSEPRTGRPWSPAVDIVETEMNLGHKLFCRGTHFQQYAENF